MIFRTMASLSSKMFQLNVYKKPLELCCLDPLTGFYRSGSCETSKDDHGTHTVCAEISAEFLAHQKGKGNDLTTPRPEFQFPGLKPGDKWCVCALRWKQALMDDVAPRIHLDSTHEKTLEVLQMTLKELEVFKVK
jgi:uncharacterized protein (DUF2237 family)